MIFIGIILIREKGSCVKMPASILHPPSSAHRFIDMTAAGEQIDQAG